mgnify:FL=1
MLFNIMGYVITAIQVSFVVYLIVLGLFSLFKKEDEKEHTNML